MSKCPAPGRGSMFQTPLPSQLPAGLLLTQALSSALPPLCQKFPGPHPALLVLPSSWPQSSLMAIVHLFGVQKWRAPLLFLCPTSQGHWTASEPQPGPATHSPSPWDPGLRSLVSRLPMLLLEGHESQGLWLPCGARSHEATSNKSPTGRPGLQTNYDG